MHDSNLDHGKPEISVETMDGNLQRSTTRSVLIVLTVTFGMMVNLADNTTMTISLAAVSRDWHLQESQTQWLISAYPLSSGCLLLMFGRVADVYGRKKVFLYGCAHLAVFTLACGFAKDIVTLNVLQGIQGIGAAATTPASLGILAASFPPSRARSLAFATFAAGAPLGAAFGNIMGGVLTEFTVESWRSTFYMQSGLIFLCFISGLISIDPDVPSTESDKRVDWLGAFLITTGLVLIVFVLAQGETAQRQWGTPYIIALLILGVFFVVLFIAWQRYLEQVSIELKEGPQPFYNPPPLMSLSLWSRGRGRFAAILCVAFMNWSAFLAWIYWVQLYYQVYKGLSIIDVVVRVSPMFVSGILCNIFVGLMAARVPLIYLLVIGTSATTLACVLFATIKPDVTFWVFGFPAACLSVMGADLVFSGGTLFVAKVSLPHEQSVAGGLFETMTQLGTALGVTISTVVFNQVKDQAASGRDDLKSYQAAQWTNVGFGLSAVIISLIFFRGVGVVGHTSSQPELPGELDPEKTTTNSPQLPDLKA